MTERNVDRAHVALGAPSDADAGDITIAPWPGRPAVGAQPLVIRLDVQRDDPHTAQIGQLLRGLPIHSPARVTRSSNLSRCFTDSLSMTELAVMD